MGKSLKEITMDKLKVPCILHRWGKWKEIWRHLDKHNVVKMERECKNCGLKEVRTISYVEKVK